MIERYALMAFRMYIGKIDQEIEERFIITMHYLMDLYTENEIEELLINDKIL